MLLGIPDDNPDGLPMLGITGLTADDARDGGRLSDDVPAELPTLTGEDCPELAVEGTLETPLGGDDLLGSDDGWFDNDDGTDDCPDESPLLESEDREPELFEGDDRLSEPLDGDKLLSEPLEPDEDRSDDSDELRNQLLRSELLGQLDDERSDEPLLPEDLLDELGEDRDDSLTLENDLLDP